MLIYLFLSLNTYLIWRVLVMTHEILNEQVSGDVWTEFMELLDEDDPESGDW